MNTTKEQYKMRLRRTEPHPLEDVTPVRLTAAVVAEALLLGCITRASIARYALKKYKAKSARIHEAVQYLIRQGAVVVTKTDSLEFSQEVQTLIEKAAESVPEVAA